MKNRTTLMKVVFLGPALLAYLAVYLYPTVRTVAMSFFKVDSVTESVSKWSFNGLANYATLLRSDLFVRSLSNLGQIWLFGGIGVAILALLFAVIITSGIRYKPFFRAVIYLPNVISAVAMGTMWIQYAYSARYGLFKTVFSALGLDKLAAIQWTSPDFVLYALIIAYSFGMVGYFMLIFAAGIEKIPFDYYEAATIDGASRFIQFRSITVPLMKGVVRTNIVLWTISIVGFFVWSMIFSPFKAEQGTVTPMVYMYQSVFGAEVVVSSRDVGAGAAVGVLLSLAVVIIFLLTKSLIRDDDLEF